MRLQIGSPKDFCAGLIFAAIGIAAVIGARNYDVGTPTQMGPGYFPSVVGVVLIVLGGASVLRGVVLTHADPIERRALEPMLLILLGVYLFSFLVDRFGLVSAVVALLLLACGRRVVTRPVEVLLIIAVMASFSVGVFIYGFGMPMSAF